MGKNITKVRDQIIQHHAKPLFVHAVHVLKGVDSVLMWIIGGNNMSEVIACSFTHKYTTCGNNIQWPGRQRLSCSFAGLCGGPSWLLLTVYATKKSNNKHMTNYFIFRYPNSLLYPSLTLLPWLLNGKTSCFSWWKPPPPPLQ